MSKTNNIATFIIFLLLSIFIMYINIKVTLWILLLYPIHLIMFIAGYNIYLDNE